MFESPSGQACFNFGFDPLVGHFLQLAAKLGGGIEAREFVRLQRNLRAGCDEMKRRLRIAHFRGPRWRAVRCK